MKITRNHIRLLFLITFLLCNPALMFAEKAVLDSDRILLFGDLENYIVKPDVPLSEKYIVKKTNKIELLNVTALRGNNPLNPKDPVNNATINGRLIYRAVDDLEGALAGGAALSGTITCVPGTLTGTDVVVVSINTLNNTCTINNDTYASNYAFDVGNPGAGAGQPNKVWVRAAFGDFRFVEVPPGASLFIAGTQWHIAPGTYNGFVLQKISTGKRWRVNMTLKGNGSGGSIGRNYANITVTVHAVIPI